MRSKGTRDGFTLAELIIYIAIFGVIGIFAARVLNVSLFANQVVSRLNEVQLVSQRALNQIIDHVHRAEVVTDASSTLVLRMEDSSKNPTIFSVSGGALMIKEGASSAASIIPTSTIIDSLSFTKITNSFPSTSSVQILMSVGYNVGGAAASGTLMTLQASALPL